MAQELRDIGLLHAKDAANLNALFPPEAVTIAAKFSGRWSEPGTWDLCRVPTATDFVSIPVDMQVEVDTVDAVAWRVRLGGGTLSFSRSVSSKLTVESVFGASHHGGIDMGTKESPIPDGIVAELVLKSDGQPFDHAKDPFEFGCGLITNAPLLTHGAPKTSWRKVVGDYQAGVNEVVLDPAPENWKPGDEVVVTGPDYGLDELMVIESVEDTKVRFTSPFAQTKIIPEKVRTRLSLFGITPTLHAANLTRNVIIRSHEDYAGNLPYQGHVMLMHPGHQLYFAAFQDTGRTDLRVPTDPKILADGTRDPQLFPLCGAETENVRGRYPLHFHMHGPDAGPSFVEDCVVRSRRNAGQRWGLANHSSHIEARRVVVYNIDGAQYVTEEGDEIGTLEHCLAIYSNGNDFYAPGQPADPECMERNYLALWQSRRKSMGHVGVGFWLQGGGVKINECVAAGHTQGINANTADLADQRGSNQFLVKFLGKLFWGGTYWMPDPEALIPVTDVPTFIMNNQIYGGRKVKNAKAAAIVYNVHQNHSLETYPLIPHSVHFGTIAWNVPNGFRSEYTSQLDIFNVHMVAGSFETAGKGFALEIGAQGGRHHVVRDSSFDDFPDAVLKIGKNTSRCQNVTTNGQPATVMIDGVKSTCGG